MNAVCEAVSVTGRFASGTTWQDLLDGAAVLGIRDAAGGETPYWCRAVVRADGQVVAYRLRKMGGDGPEHELPRTLMGCTCADRKYARRPSGCKHMVALRQALAALPAREEAPAH
jgi:hypothetical protein